MNSIPRRSWHFKAISLDAFSVDDTRGIFFKTLAFSKEAGFQRLDQSCYPTGCCLRIWLMQQKCTLWTRLLWRAFASGLLGTPAEMQRFRHVPRHRGVTGQGREASPILHGALGSSEWPGSPPAQTTPILKMLKVSQKQAPNHCETGLRLGFQSVRFTLYCVSSKNYLSIIDLPSLKMFQLCVSFAQLSFFIFIFTANLAQDFSKEF